MQPRIETLPQKQFIGKSLRMSLANNRTAELWKSFMPHRKLIKNTVGSDLYSMQVYDDSLNFKDFNPQTEFRKFALILTTASSEVIPLPFALNVPVTR